MEKSARELQVDVKEVGMTMAGMIPLHLLEEEREDISKENIRKGGSVHRAGWLVHEVRKEDS